MSTTTTNLSLVKPASNENVDLSVINGNYDKIDEFAGGVVQTSDVATSSGHVTGIGQNTVSVVSATTDANSKLASITVDGTSYNVPTKTSDLTNDSSFAAVVANPSSGSAIGTLSSLSVNGEKFSVPSGGDTVGWNQIQGSGVQIATVTINGTPTAVYAPEGGGVFEPNGESYNVTASKDGNDTALTLEYYINETMSSAITIICDAGSSSTRDFNNLHIASNGTTVSISSKVDSIRFNGAIFDENDEIISVTIGSATSTYTDLEEGTYTSGGGSEVEWTQVQQSGTKIAEISIDGTPQDVYAPTPTTVVANPSESATTELSSLKVGSTVYSLPSGGGSWEIGDTYYIFSFDNSNGGSLTATEYLMEGSTPTQVDTATISFVSIIGGGPSYVEIDDIELRWNGTAATYNINCLVDKVQYDGTQYEVGDNVYSVAQAGTSVSNQRIDKLVQGGGGGSVVSWSQTQQSGTKIAEITIDGSTQNVYAPTVPTKTSDLTNDSNFVADASYVHTDNNYTTNEKNKLSGLVAVEANPSSGTSVGDLTSIAIGGSKYDIPSGGGGTTVVANPSGTATANLDKLQVGNDIYAIPSGGGDIYNLVPRLTANDSSPVGTASADGTLSSLFQPWHAFATEDSFDASQNGGYWASDSNGGYLQFAFANSVTIKKLAFGVYDASTFTIYYSNDGTNYTEGDAISAIPDKTGYICRKTEHLLTGPITCRYIRLVATGAQNIGAVHFYGDSGTGGETTVIANPSGEATVELEKLQVGNTIYSLPTGEGGGLTKTTLYTLTGNTPESVVTLSDTIENYDLIEIVTLYGHEDQNDYKQNAIFNSDELIASIGTARPTNWHVGNDTVYTWIYVTDVDEFTIHVNSGQTGLGIWYVYGYKFNGSSSESSSDYIDVVGTLTAGSTSITLNSPKIKTGSCVFPWASVFGLTPTSMVVQNGSVTLTFPAQQSDVDIMVRVTKLNTGHVYDIDLSTLQPNKSWFYYDANKSSVNDTGDGLQISGDDQDNSWTTSGVVCINIANMIGTIPSGLTALKLHFKTFEMSGYTGVRFMNSNTLYTGQTGGSDSILRANGFYQFENNNSSIDEDNYELTIPCAASNLVNDYLYIMFFDGMVAGSTNTYNNSLNGSYNIIIDGIDYVTGGN